MLSKISILCVLAVVLFVNGAPPLKETPDQTAAKESSNNDPVPPANNEGIQQVPGLNKVAESPPPQSPKEPVKETGIQAKLTGAKTLQDHKNVVKSKKDTEEPWVLCYFTNWAQYRPDPGTFWPEDIDVNLCTHVYYAFGWMDGNNLTTYEVNDIELYGRVNALKQQKPSLKTVLAVGGWTFGTSKMTLMLSSKENRTEFINNAINYVRHFNFDGLDLDFEWPGSRGSPPEDKYLYTCLIKEIRAAFDNENPTNPLIFTAGVGAGFDRVEMGYEMLELSKHLDKISLMTYDFFGGLDETANPHSMMYNRPGMTDHGSKYNVDYSVQLWIAAGVPKHKLILGVALYGRGNTLQYPFITNPGAPSVAPSTLLNYTLQDGIACYYEFCSIILPKATRMWSQDHLVPYCYFGDQWFGYEDSQSMEIKMTYIKTQGLAGAMVWAVDYDDFNNQFCGQGRYPMLNLMKNALADYLVPVEDDGIPPPNDFFCFQQPDGYYRDPESCQRFYYCNGGATEALYCSPPTIYDPLFQGCRNPADMDLEWVCANCPEHGDCSENKWYCEI